MRGLTGQNGSYKLPIIKHRGSQGFGYRGESPYFHDKRTLN